jgi:hypothetical protein
MQVIIRKSNSTLILSSISLLKTLEKIVFTTYVQPIPIASFFTGGGVGVMAAGWGLTASGPANQLQFLKKETVTNAECIKYINALAVPLSKLCTKNYVGRGICTVRQLSLNVLNVCII